MYVLTYTYLPNLFVRFPTYSTSKIMGITQGSKKMGYYQENEPNTYQTNSTYFYPQSDPMGTDRQTNKQPNKQTNEQMDGRMDKYLLNIQG